MNTKFLSLAACLLFVSAVVFGQDKGAITFKETTHEFGKVKEEVGKISCVFEFTNTGKAPIILNNVAPSCGCTTPEWTKDPVMPGKTGTITATYVTTGRPNAFVKTLTVTSNAEPATVVLTIKGEVEPAAPKQPEPAKK